jgi:hypothetical protein
MNGRSAKLSKMKAWHSGQLFLLFLLHIIHKRNNPWMGFL